MAISDSSYSKLVAWLKLLLPLVALGILSTLFFLARGTGPEMSLGIDDDQIAELAEEQRLSTPSYLGVTPDGAAISFSADVARPDPTSAERLIATTVSGRIEPDDGSWVSIASRDGVLNTDAGTARLTGGVVMETSTGIRMTTDALNAELGLGEVSTDLEVVVDAPFGRLTANAMRYSSGQDTPEQNLLVFSNGVYLIYQPVN